MIMRPICHELLHLLKAYVSEVYYFVQFTGNDVNLFSYSKS